MVSHSHHHLHQLSLDEQNLETMSKMEEDDSNTFDKTPSMNSTYPSRISQSSSFPTNTFPTNTFPNNTYPTNTFPTFTAPISTSKIRAIPTSTFLTFTSPTGASANSNFPTCTSVTTSDPSFENCFPHDTSRATSNNSPITSCRNIDYSWYNCRPSSPGEPQVNYATSRKGGYQKETFAEINDRFTS